MPAAVPAAGRNVRRRAAGAGAAGLAVVMAGLLPATAAPAATTGPGVSAGSPPGAAAPPALGAAHLSAAALAVPLVWSQTIVDGSNPIAQSSPNVATLDAGGPAAVVGDRSGKVYAYHLSDGTAVAGWPVGTGGVPVDSTPSVSGSTVYVGAGNAAVSNAGGYLAFNGNGSARWRVTAPLTPGASNVAGVQASLAVGSLQGQTAVVAGSLGQYEDAINASSGAVLPGFPWFQADSSFSTPAIADLYSNGQSEIVQGGDSTAGNAFNNQYSNGGHIRILSQTANLGQAQPSGGLVCQYDTTQVAQASPAVGRFLGGAGVGIVSGTGSFYDGASDTNRLLAVDTHCNLVWAATLDAGTGSSPVLVDGLGNGSLQVAEGTNAGNRSGSVYLLNGSNGSTIWRVPAAGAVLGSIATADLGNGHQDLIVPTTGGVQILDGATGTQLATLDTGQVAFQNAPLVTADPDGTIGITVAGYNAAGSRVDHFKVLGTNGALVNEAGAWPQFHHDPQLSGNAGTPAPVINVACRAPAGGPRGYWEVASDGGIFSFGNLPFCGSTGNIVLNRPVVGMAGTPSGGGYWTVASDGGIFSFGDAGFHGSTGSMRLNQTIVGMAATPSGQGYWLVAADGGIFSFGDAAYHGSTGGTRLNRTIVGMAATPSGQGYWLVAADGGIFSFGDAAYHGSTGGTRLNRPIVGMAADAATGGYWLMASDGGVFAFAATFRGSAGGLNLVQPIVGTEATGGDSGYRLIAADGGVFDYGSAAYYGSQGGKPLNRPIVGTAGS